MKASGMEAARAGFVADFAHEARLSRIWRTERFMNQYLSEINICMRALEDLDQNLRDACDLDSLRRGLIEYFLHNFEI